jgi:hypothetical protein
VIMYDMRVVTSSMERSTTNGLSVVAYIWHID